jgi:hypothetical protein
MLEVERYHWRLTVSSLKNDLMSCSTHEIVFSTGVFLSKRLESVIEREVHEPRFFIAEPHVDARQNRLPKRNANATAVA